MSRKKPTEAIWSKIRLDREKYGLSFNELASKYEMSSATIYRKSKIDRWSIPVNKAKDPEEVKQPKKKIEPACFNENETDETKRNETDETKRNETDETKRNETDETPCLNKDNKDQDFLNTLKARLDPSKRWNREYLEHQLAGIDQHLSDLANVYKREPEHIGKYRPEFAKIAYNIALLGGTPTSLANTLSVCEATIHNWLNDHKEFAIAWIGGKDFADAQVAKALFKRAIGFEIKVTDFKVVDGSLQEVDKTLVFAGDVAAQKFWLTNRQPHNFKEKVEVQEEISIAIIDKEAAQARYNAVLNKASELQAKFQGRAERLNLMLDGDCEEID